MDQEDGFLSLSRSSDAKVGIESMGVMIKVLNALFSMIDENPNTFEL